MQGKKQGGLVARLFIGVALLWGCAPSSDDVVSLDEDQLDLSPVIYTVNYPLAYCAQRIGGGNIRVNFPAPVIEDPASWLPDVETIGKYQRGDLILLNGAGYAAWVQKATLPASKLIDTSAAFSDRYLANEDVITHTHGPAGEHTHQDLAVTTWLDPQLALLQAQAIHDALVQRWPEFRTKFDSGYQGLEQDLIQLDQAFQKVFQKFADQALLFSHPLYQYLIQRYDLNARSVHWEPNEALSASQLRSLNKLLTTHTAKVMIWEDAPEQATRRSLDERGISSVIFRTGANRPPAGDYLSVMEDNLTNLRLISQ